MQILISRQKHPLHLLLGSSFPDLISLDNPGDDSEGLSEENFKRSSINRQKRKIGRQWDWSQRQIKEIYRKNGVFASLPHCTPSCWIRI